MHSQSLQKHFLGIPSRCTCGNVYPPVPTNMAYFDTYFFLGSRAY
ncbi:hypothetical protein SFUMM280S_09133 [Streptomyces fumanus]